MIEWIHPATFFFLGAVLIPFIKGKGRQILLLAVPAIAFISLLFASQGNHNVLTLMDQDLIFGRVDRLSLVFGYIFTIIAFIGMIYALHVGEEGEHIAAFLYAGSALGVVFAGDLLTLFIFWEIMAFSSVFLIWYGGERAAGAGFRYLMVHIFGGLCLLGGILIYAIQSKSIAFDAIPSSGLGGMLILLGFLVNAAAPPLHAWLPDAYPESTVTGTVFLSSFTTKTAVYVLARGFAGTGLLVWLGTLMTLYGIFYTLLENDTRRLLSYHIISQVGYMVAGIGIGTELAINGAVGHAFNNLLYKGLLMMGMGSVIQMTGRRKGTELGGLYKNMPLTFFLYMIGGFSISGVPFFAGFISKAMVISAAAEEHLAPIVLLLTMAAAGTFLSTTLKLPYVVFFGEDKKISAKDPPKNMLLGMGLAAFLCILVGSWPAFLYRLLPFPVEYHAYTAEHLVGSLQILLFTSLGFILFLHKLHPERTISLDFDWFYRKGTEAFLWIADQPLARYEEFIINMYKFVIIEPTVRLANFLWLFDQLVIDSLVNAMRWITILGSKIFHLFDVYVVDGIVNVMRWITILESREVDNFDIYVVDGVGNEISTGLDLSARGLRRLHTGRIQNYMLAMVLGVVIYVVVILIFIL